MQSSAPDDRDGTPAEFGAWCAPCRFRVNLQSTNEALLELIHSPERAFEAVTLVAGLLSPEGKPHSVRLIATGSNAREPGAYIEFAADHEPFWTHRAWVAASALRALALPESLQTASAAT